MEAGASAHHCSQSYQETFYIDLNFITKRADTEEISLRICPFFFALEHYSIIEQAKTCSKET
jgi:hypothetical protein